MVICIARRCVESLGEVSTGGRKITGIDSDWKQSLASGHIVLDPWVYQPTFWMFFPCKLSPAQEYFPEHRASLGACTMYRWQFHFHKTDSLEPLKYLIPCGYDAYLYDDHSYPVYTFVHTVFDRKVPGPSSKISVCDSTDPVPSTYCMHSGRGLI